MAEAVDLAAALTATVEKILQTANTVPVRLLATFVWEEGSSYEELVPRIEIEWQRDNRCSVCQSPPK